MFAPAFAVIRAANDGSVLEEKLRVAFAECWRVALDAVTDKYGSDAGRRLAGVPADGGHRSVIDETALAECSPAPSGLASWSHDNPGLQPGLSHCRPSALRVW